MLPAIPRPSLPAPARRPDPLPAREPRRSTQLPRSSALASYFHRLEWLFGGPPALTPTRGWAARSTPQLWQLPRVGGAPVAALGDELARATHNAYASNGGIACGTLILELLRDHSSQPISRVARWIVAREIVQFRWRGETMFPLFQFDPTNMSIRQSTREVVAELAPAFDDLALAEWFVRPNSWLEDAPPVAVVQSDSQAVLAAARADRFAILG